MLSFIVDELVVFRPRHIMVECCSKANVFLSSFLSQCDGLPQLCVHAAILVMSAKFSRTHGQVSSEHFVSLNHW